eukprot:TRINITY_DN12488_c0_g1_i1.p1 TRINITY_DN12488_c0_g1~~TRINITY_DN12488_c0_g1_i1.p1  ORF type:complete len:579 (+),score=135.12 TRINITY_DN12488_c0_g1_i1:1-1737(+)
MTLDRHDIAEIKELLLSGDFDLVNSYCSVVYSNDALDRAEGLNELLKVFILDDQIQPFIVWSVQKEVDETSNASELFRGTSIAALLVDEIFLQLCKGYIQCVLVDVVKKIVLSEKDYEIDSNKVDPKTSRSNCRKLAKLAQAVLDDIIENEEEFPWLLKYIFSKIREIVESKFSGYWNVSVGAFFFLRLICPALVFPDRWDIVEVTPKSNSRRALILISKLLQNLANSVEFDGKKEPYMLPLNRFIVNNKLKAYQLLDSLSVFDPDEPYEPANFDIESIDEKKIITHIGQQMVTNTTSISSHIKQNGNNLLSIQFNNIVSNLKRSGIKSSGKRGKKKRNRRNTEAPSSKHKSKDKEKGNSVTSSRDRLDIKTIDRRSRRRSFVLDESLAKSVMESQKEINQSEAFDYNSLLEENDKLKKKIERLENENIRLTRALMKNEDQDNNHTPLFEQLENYVNSDLKEQLTQAILAEVMQSFEEKTQLYIDEQQDTLDKYVVDIKTDLQNTVKNQLPKKKTRSRTNSSSNNSRENARKSKNSPISRPPPYVPKSSSARNVCYHPRLLDSEGSSESLHMNTPSTD